MEVTGNTNKRAKHVAVFAFPFASHPRHLLTLVRKVAYAAPTVVFSFFCTEKSNQVLFSKTSCDNILPYNISDGIPKDNAFEGNIVERVHLFMSVVEEELRRGMQVAEMDTGMRVSCLVTDAFFWFVGDMAEKMNIPWVTLYNGSPYALSTHLYTDIIREKTAQIIGSARLKEEVVDFIPGLKAVPLVDIPSEVLGNLESLFPAMLYKMGKTLDRATVVVMNSYEELDIDLTKNLSSKLNNLLNIGPFNLISKETTTPQLDEHSCISWLDNQKTRTVAYLCFGTVFTPPPQELVALAETLEETKTPFLWSLNKESNKHFPKGFLERTNANGTGKVVPWAPQDEVLNHVAIGVYVTHGGWNSVMESVGAGVPMICRPFLGDQYINSWMVDRVWEIGLRIQGGNFTKHATRLALEQVFSHRYEKMEALKDLAHKAIDPNGSSIQNFKALVEVVNSATGCEIVNNTIFIDG